MHRAMFDACDFPSYSSGSIMSSLYGLSCLSLPSELLPKMDTYDETWSFLSWVTEKLKYCLNHGVNVAIVENERPDWCTCNFNGYGLS